MRPLHEKNGLRGRKSRLAFTLVNRCISNVRSDSILLHIILEFGEILNAWRYLTGIPSARGANLPPGGFFFPEFPKSWTKDDDMRGVAGGILHVDFSDLEKHSRLVRRSLPSPLSGSHIARFCPRRDRFRDEVPNSAAASNEARVGRLASPRALPKSTANRDDSGTKTEVSHEEKPI